MPLSEEEFSRLPPEIQSEAREREQSELTAAAAYRERLKKRGIYAAVLAGGGSLFVAMFLSDSISFLFILTAATAAAGWFTVELRLKIFGGIFLVGGVGMLANVIGLAMGLVAPLALFASVLNIALGAMVGAWADLRRTSEDVGF